MSALIDLTGGAPGAALLLAAIVIASLYGLLKAPQMVVNNLLRPYWLVPRREYVTLITNAFLHADLAHLFFNAITFWAFAFDLERRIGTAPFLALYAFGLLVSDAGTWLRHRDDPDYRCLGASGAILAVLFASIVYFPTASIFILPLPVPVPAPVFALAYLAYSWYASRHMRGGVNHDAHLSGAVAGLLFVALTDSAALVQAWQAIGSMVGSWFGSGAAAP
ncbi:MAG: rhomboid family intramembrane serine protease [Burkholderiales bacterium]